MSTRETEVIGSDNTVKEYVLQFLQSGEDPAKVASAIIAHFKGDAHDAEALIWSMWEKLAGPFSIEGGGVRPHQKSGPCVWLMEVVNAIVDHREVPRVKRTSKYDFRRKEQEEAKQADNTLALAD